MGIQQFIAPRYDQKPSLEELAAVLCLSRSRTAHVVKEVCGKPFGELVVETRIRAAAGLLQHSNLTVAAIAEKWGFSDASRFHRVFRKRMQCTPSQYRQRVHYGVIIVASPQYTQ